jgi:hypothetical protein
MSKLARAVVLVAMLAAMHLAGLVAAAQAHTSNDPASARHAALGRVGFLATGDAQRLFRRGERASLDQPTAGTPTADATLRGLLAQERYYSTWDYEDPTVQQALAQERYYSTWGYGDTPTSDPAPDEPSGQPGWPTPALGVLAAVLALVAGVAVVATRRAHRSQRASQTA